MENDDDQWNVAIEAARTALLDAAAIAERKKQYYRIERDRENAGQYAATLRDAAGSLIGPLKRVVEVKIKDRCCECGLLFDTPADARRSKTRPAWVHAKCEPTDHTEDALDYLRRNPCKVELKDTPCVPLITQQGVLELVEGIFRGLIDCPAAYEFKRMHGRIDEIRRRVEGLGTPVPATLEATEEDEPSLSLDHWKALKFQVSEQDQKDAVRMHEGTQAIKKELDGDSGMLSIHPQARKLLKLVHELDDQFEKMLALLKHPCIKGENTAIQCTACDQIEHVRRLFRRFRPEVQATQT